MTNKERGLVNKILWTQKVVKLDMESPLNKTILETCQKLEEQGFGMLEDSNYRGNIDEKGYIVSPDGRVFAPEQISEYWIERKGEFNSENKEDMEMHKINMYYSGFNEFKSRINLSIQ